MIFRVRDEDGSRPQRGAVLVRVHAVSLNFRDIAMLRGRYPVPHRKGLIPTSDGAGEVIEVGPGGGDFKVGDRVMGVFHPSLRAITAGGEIAAVGFLSTENPSIDFFALFGSGATFRHIAVGSREGLQESPVR